MSQATFDPRIHNQSHNESFESILEKTISRRTVVHGGFKVAAATMLGGLSLASCGGDHNTSTASDSTGSSGGTGGSATSGTRLGFKSIAGSRTDAVVVPTGYRAQVLAPWGTPLNANAAEWKDDGTNTSLDQANSVGMHHDGMQYFAIEGSSTDGLLVINHEYIDQNALHPNGATRDPGSNLRTEVEEIRKEINAHGVSVIRIQRGADDQWRVVTGDPLNRRYTGATEMDVSGPAAGANLLVTRYSPDGSVARGTLNNCGNGYTPWGTYLTCEENWPGYFVNKGELTADQKRIGVDAEDTRYGWDDLAGAASELADEFARFDITPTAGSAAQDYRNEANGHGYIVEIDPYTADSRAVKRSALGRFRHEGCVPGKLEAGKPVVFYSGHDARGEYIYKFVSATNWDPADATPADRLATGAKYMDQGTLYVARFNEDGSGQWLPLETANPALLKFKTQAEVILNTVEAADLVGATPMDRPEWGAVDPVTGSVYFTLTNNSRRGVDGSASESTPNARNAPDAANPRSPNNTGHIIRWDETDDHRNFTWDIFVFGSDAAGDAEKNKSGLVELNQFASPDGLVFDDRGIMWIQTDNGAPELTEYTNDQMLAVVPSQLTDADGNQVPVSADNQVELRRFFVGPNGCEVTGLAFSPDLSGFFVNIQHPRNWPQGDDAAVATTDGVAVRPRAATVVISKIDGGAVGV